jgi:hypothetical protein
MSESLLLKWGTIKGFGGLSNRSIEIVERFFADGVPASAMTDRPDDTRRAILCELIDQFEGSIQNDWSGEMMSKEAAKEYIMNYGKRTPAG